MHTLRHGAPGSQGGVLTPSAEQTLPATPASVPEARRFAAATLTAWGVTDSGDVVQVTSELAANAVREGQAVPGGRILLRLALTERTVIVQAGDVNPAAPPRPTRRAADAESGRGLQIARALSGRLGWFVDVDSGLKIVWADVLRPGIRRRSWDTWTRRLGLAA